MLFYQIIILVGVSLIIYSLDRLYQLLYPAYRHATAGANWPETTGTITNVRLSSFYRGRGGRFFWMEAKYAYVVGETGHTGKLKQETLLGRKAAALQNTEKFPPGKELQVRYNPQHPAECYTEFDRLNLYQLISVLWMPVCGLVLIISVLGRL